MYYVIRLKAKLTFRWQFKPIVSLISHQQALSLTLMIRNTISAPHAHLSHCQEAHVFVMWERRENHVVPDNNGSVTGHSISYFSFLSFFFFFVITCWIDRPQLPLGRNADWAEMLCVNANKLWKTEQGRNEERNEAKIKEDAIKTA